MRRCLLTFSFATAALLSTALVLQTSTAAAQRSPEPFSADERRRLIAGELVRRDLTRNVSGQRLFGGTSWQRVRAPLERVWDVVSDPSTYPRLIPSLERARVIEHREGRRVVQMHHAFGVGSADYHAIISVDAEARTVRFELDPSRPGDVQAGHGFITLTPYRGGTIVEWGMLADVGAGMLQQLFSSVLNDWLLKPPRCIRDEVEEGRVNEC